MQDGAVIMSNSDFDNKTVLVNGITFSHRDINKVVDSFYLKIQHDEILKIPFQSVHDWPEHIERLTHFWWIKFGGKPYMFNEYNPVLKHFFAGFNEALLTRWLSIFQATLAEHLTHAQCVLWTNISDQMGRGLLMKNEIFRIQHTPKGQ